MPLPEWLSQHEYCWLMPYYLRRRANKTTTTATTTTTVIATEAPTSAPTPEATPPSSCDAIGGVVCMTCLDDRRFCLNEGEAPKDFCCQFPQYRWCGPTQCS